jgi:hypothetical protein
MVDDEAAEIGNPLIAADYSGGRTFCSSLLMSGERRGSSPSQSMH